MNTRITPQVLMIVALLFSFSDLAESGGKNAPEQVAFEVNNLSYAFEQTLPNLSKAYIDLSPANKMDGIATGKLVDSKNLIAELAREMVGPKHGYYDSMLISYKNKLVFESYYRKGRINLPHFQASVTKSYLSLAIGRAIELGYMTMADLNKPIVQFLKDLKTEKLADGAENITLHQALSMRSGIRLSDDRRNLIMENRSKTKGYNIVQAVLQYSEPISRESQIFNYQDADPIIAMRILDSLVPGNAKTFIKNEVLAKLGITVYGWRNDINGLPVAESGSSMTSRAMLKLGALVNNKGQWNGEQLISEEYLTKATSNITDPNEDWIPDTFNYGYYWYQTGMAVGDKTYDVKLAWGAGGQRILLIRDLDLIVVITGHDREDKIMSKVSTNVLPAFVKN